MQQRLQKQYQGKRIFSASEVAEFEYCPLAWWHEQFEPIVRADTEELFANLVQLEHEHGPQAPNLPEYQVIEQILLRRGAFEEGRQQHQGHAKEIAELEEERLIIPGASSYWSRLAQIALVMLLLAVLILIISWLLFIRH